ncbi:ACT domain-containing protein [Microdochium trichocladiopsis]|uniref:ACT domain-containing protein n=1 Tax=Microdochium trichocladiopsis TaxID=1682393 RepID=A0A9P8Y8X9_9PEZI|nr:ACT domain-containing protein [Microdochium trichocladiopsis]KAH7032960.1 ACT domain-containing protein [Microdochium trichocladiopsis]
MNASISFLDGTYSLIHIPLDIYGALLQPILQVLLPHDAADDPAEGFDNLTIDGKHSFLNISITPVECSVVCHSALTKDVFEPALRRLPAAVASRVTISKDTYLILSVINAGMDAGSRVSELTSPLAMANIPIFFITTYYSDFILVPSKDRESVLQALIARNFEFSEDGAAYVSAGPAVHSPRTNGKPPSTPPPSTVAELQVRTFALLKKRKVVPYIVDGLALVQCAGREESHYVDYTHRPTFNRSATGNGFKSTWLDSIDTRLYTSLIAVLAMQPKFLSFTLAQEDPPSLLMDKTLVPIFGNSLNGDVEGNLVPIVLDLVDLPLEATGIVSGVAGKLVIEMNQLGTEIGRELVYLSTARAGTVILSGETAAKALEVLKSHLTQEG